MRRMSTKPGARDWAVRPYSAADPDCTADAFPPVSLEQIYELVTASLAVIID